MTLNMELLGRSFLPDNFSLEFTNDSLGEDGESAIKSLINSSGRNSPLFPVEDKEYIFDRFFVRAIFITVYTIVFCSCFFGNLLVILLITLHWRMRSITNFCLANLAFANLCVGVFCIYQNLSTYLITSWVFGDFMCKMYHFMNSLSYTASILILVVICIERYLAIIHPIRCRQILTINRLRASIVAVWIVSAIYCSPRLYYITTITIPRRDGEIETLCIPKRTLYDSATFDVINFLLMFLVPLLVISVLYTMIGITLWKSSHDQMPAPTSTATSNSVGKAIKQSRSFSQIEEVERGSRTCESSSLVILSQLGGKNDIERSGTRTAPSSYFYCCLGKKGRESKEWNLYAADSSGKASKRERPSLILTDAQDIDHILLESEDCIGGTMGTTQKDIPSISVTVEGKLTWNEIRNKRRLKLRKQGTIGKKNYETKLGNTPSHDSDDVFCNDTQSPGCKKNTRTFRFGSRVTAFSQPKDNRKHKVNGDSMEKGKRNHMLRLNSNQELSISSEDIPLNDVQRSPALPTLKRAGAMKANRIGAQALQSRRKVIRMLIVIVVTFSICNLPFHARKLWQIWSSSYRGGSVFSTLFTPCTFLIMYANCAINPILYGFMSVNFRQSFRDLLCCRLRHQMDKSHRRRPSERFSTVNSTLISERN